MTTPTPDKHAPSTHADGATCEHCIMPAPTNKSATIAWIVAGIATTLLIIVYFLGVGTRGGTIVAGTGFVLLGVLLCPLMMGGMMWFMMRKH